MLTKRKNAITGQMRLAEELRNSKVASSDKTLKKYVDETCTWANHGGTMACMSEINNRMDAIKAKVRDAACL